MALCFSYKVYMYLAGRYNDCLFQFINSSRAYVVNLYCFFINLLITNLIGPGLELFLIFESLKVKDLYLLSFLVHQ